ncbi:BadF/BadG/BcrA/BcrD ATPase family protein [Palleronia caenipelagi]|uniref:ATPase n=1 Tax=Palleronia caenipelagi TaxID=2489174 RepID=A0A547Q2P0_9RHOB|nr:BadF/BadG/BcrA/BcrD ATPase family protein [Palleronia caenipelagi]TRD20639.1 ATPase [Palleronia caenipelagi]
MTKPTKTHVIAIDGGGTRCRIALSGSGPRVSVETGPANVFSDFSGAVEAITSGLAALADATKRTVDDLSEVPAFVGVAGVIAPDIAEQLGKALPFRQAQVADDRLAALRGALGIRDGVVAHCGTGSFIAARISGETRLAGGWGADLGDEASAQWVGRRALALTLEVVDGRRVASELSDQLLANLDGAAGILRFAARATPAEFGALAPLVTHGAEDGDAIATFILRAAGAEIDRAARAIGWQPGLPVCLTGGIGPHFARWLPPELAADLAPPDGDPLDGAISLARDFAEGLAP